FDKVTAVGLVLCNTLYITIAWACLAAFGRGVDTNVLNDMTASAMAPLLGPQPAALLALLVRLMFFVSLLGSFVLNLHPLRHCCMEVLGDAVRLTHKKQLVGPQAAWQGVE
ncbi:Aa_trans domain-containing protein, partial [Haematococcus lacustris]